MTKDPAHEIYAAPRKMHDERFSKDCPSHLFEAELIERGAIAINKLHHEQWPQLVPHWGDLNQEDKDWLLKTSAACFEVFKI